MKKEGEQPLLFLALFNRINKELNRVFLLFILFHDRLGHFQECVAVVSIFCE